MIEADWLGAAELTQLNDRLEEVWPSLFGLTLVDSSGVRVLPASTLPEFLIHHSAFTPAECRAVIGAMRLAREDLLALLDHPNPGVRAGLVMQPDCDDAVLFVLACDSSELVMAALERRSASAAAARP